MSEITEIKEEALHDFEKETVINFNKEEQEASIFTYEKSWQRHLEQKVGLKPIFVNGFGGKEYIINKDRIRMPKASPSKRNRKKDDTD